MMKEQNQEPVVFIAIEGERAAEEAEEVLNEAAFLEAQRKNLGQRKNKQTDPSEGEAKLHFQRFNELIRELAKKVREGIAAKYPSVKIIEFRASLHSFPDGLSLLTVLDSVDIDTELLIGLLLSDIEKDFAKERKTPCGIRSMRKIKYVDGAKVVEQFPFVVKA
jgi:hypothetical protein